MADYDRELIAEMLADLADHGTFTGESVAEQIRLLRKADNAEAAGVHTATQPPAVGVDVIEINEDTIDILGRPNFACAAIARTLRLRGDEIPNRSENEQAATIAFLLGHYFVSGAGWRESATEELSRITSQRVTAALRTGGGA